MAELSASWKRIASSALLILCLAFVAMFFKAGLDGRFHSVASLHSYIRSFGALAPLMLIALQAAQVVIPVLPGFLGCAVGAALFGSMGGFWCNYIGISIGSILAFFLARRFGSPLVRKLFPPEKYEKWSNWAARSRSYAGLLFLGTLLPLFPDDFFCYFSGLTQMTARRFIWIILLGKPWCILAYSFLFAAIL